MSRTRIARVAMAAVLGSALAARAGAQQDSSAAPGTGSGAPGQTAPSAPAPSTPAPSAVVPLPAPAAHAQAHPSARGPRALRLRAAAPATEGPRLGVKVKQTPDGLLVTDVLDGTLAANIGVKAQDVILRIDDEHIESVADVQRTLSMRAVGETVSVAVIRAGEGIVTLSGTLPEPPAQPAPEAPVPAPQAEPPAPQAEPEDQQPAQADGFRGGFLGVQLVEPDGGKAGANDGATTSKDGDTASAPGVEVAGVVPESAAWFAGLEQGDRILAIDGKDLASRQDLVGAVLGKEPGTFVDVKYVHAGEERTARARLGERHEGNEVGALFPGLHFMPFGGQGAQAGPGGQGGGSSGPDLPRLRGHGGGAGLPHGAMQGFPFGDDDAFDDGLPGGIQQFLQGLDLDGQGNQRQSVRVEMRNGKGTLSVTRDGRTETYVLDDQGHWVKSAAPDTSAPNAGDPGAAPSGTAQDTTHQGSASAPLRG